MSDPKVFARAASAQDQPPTPERMSTFAAIDALFADCFAEIDALKARVAELERKPAARTVEHQRDSSGALIRSVLVEQS